MNSIMFLLVITLSKPGVMAVSGYGPPIDSREKIIVSSPESAAVVIWQKNEFPGFNSRHDGELYKIDIKNGTVEKINIPILKFVEGPV